MDMLKYETKYWNMGINYIAGIDEAGRGPLAGPVVASCVILNPNTKNLEVKDSKELSETQRYKLYHIINTEALDVSIGIANEKEIDSLNILQATLLEIRRAIGNLKCIPEQLLIDGPYSNIKLFKVENIINGDNKSASIAAASIIAKVSRDKMMYEYDLIFPEYKFCNNKGYGTKQHIKALELNQATPIHRKTFKIVKSHLPTFAYYEQNNKFHVLGRQIIASNLIKKNYNQCFDKLFIEEINDYIDYAYSNFEQIIFVKILTLYKTKTKHVNSIENINIYIDFIESKIMKKESKKKFTFDVISIEFKQNNKPIIKNLYSEKNY